MAIVIIFLLGIGNFALHKAVLESGHPLLGQFKGFSSRRGRAITLLLEFAVLLAAMLLAANGWTGLAIAYAMYSALNALTAWLILSGRV